MKRGPTPFLRKALREFVDLSMLPPGDFTAAGNRRDHGGAQEYGQEVTARLSEEDEARERARLQAILENIRSGKFARDWTRERQQGKTAWRRIHEKNPAHPLIVRRAASDETITAESVTAW